MPTTRPDGQAWCRPAEHHERDLERGDPMAGKFGLDPRELDDAALERELRYLYATREEAFFHALARRS